MNFTARIHCRLRVNTELCYIREETCGANHHNFQPAIGDWERKLKCTFVLNMQQATIYTAALLRKWGREDKHPPTLVFLYNFSEDNKSRCSSYFFLSGTKAQTATDITRMFPTDLFYCTCLQSSLHFRPRIIFPGCNQDSAPHGFSHSGHFCYTAEAPMQRQQPPWAASALHGGRQAFLELDPENSSPFESVSLY